MLDNMNLKSIKRAVKLNKGISRPKIEVSGNINLSNVRKVAQTGVDIISIGSLTHSVKAIDMALEIK
jgi:nicotinate-nucleotide pyrophosphorylase (carboxylating)